MLSKSPYVTPFAPRTAVRPEERAARLEGLVTSAHALPSRRRFAPHQGERTGAISSQNERTGVIYV